MSGTAGEWIGLALFATLFAGIALGVYGGADRKPRIAKTGCILITCVWAVCAAGVILANLFWPQVLRDDNDIIPSVPIRIILALVVAAFAAFVGLVITLFTWVPYCGMVDNIEESKPIVPPMPDDPDLWADWAAKHGETVASGHFRYATDER